MNPPHLLYLNKKGTSWFNPGYGLNGFWNEYRKLSQKLNKPHDYVWNHRDLKRAKEIYAISIIAKAMEIQEKTGPWWILKPDDDPPDGVIGTIIDGKMSVREVEVVECMSKDILETIRKKLSRKRYEPNTFLVCYLSDGGIYNLEEISNIISIEETSLDKIFIVFTGTKLDSIPQSANKNDVLRAIFKVSSVQIKPTYSFVAIDPIKDCEGWENSSFFIFEKRGMGDIRPIKLENPPKLFR